MVLTLRLALIGWALTALAADTAPARWPQFRGPGGGGTGSEEATPPAAFGPSKAVLWKTPLPIGHGSPCIWDDRIFVTSFDKAGSKLELIALNRTNGKVLWRSQAPATEIETVHEISSPATSTPVTDGHLIYVYFGSYGVLAYNWDGKIAWQFPLPLAKSPYGSGTSPVLAGDLVIIGRDYMPEPQLIAVSQTDGKLKWKVTLPANGTGSKTAHSTPAIWRDQVLLHRSGELSAYSLKDGARVWWVKMSTQGTSTPLSTPDALYVEAFSIVGEPNAIPEFTPFATLLEKYDRNKDGKLSRDELPDQGVFIVKRVGVPDDVPGAHFTLKTFFGMVDTNHDGFVDEKEWTATGNFGKAFKREDYGLMAIKPGGEGDLSASAVQWSEKRSVAEVPSPLLYRGRVYMVSNGGVATCVEAKGGKELFRARIGAPGAYYASPVAAGGKVYLTSVDGVVSVLEAQDDLKVLSNNDLGEPIFGTPALVGSTVYIRSVNHLWAFR